MKPFRQTLIYIAGPYRGTSERAVFANIMRAREMAIAVWEEGFTAICPHLNTMLFGGAVPDDAFLEGDLEIVRRCDAVLVLIGYQDSTGTLAEIEFAKSIDKPVFYSLGDLLDYEPQPDGADTFSLNPFRA